MSIYPQNCNFKVYLFFLFSSAMRNVLIVITIRTYFSLSLGKYSLELKVKSKRLKVLRGGDTKLCIQKQDLEHS